MNKVLTLKEHNLIFDTLDGLTPDEVGSIEFEDFVLLFEGFTDNCQEDIRNRCLLPKEHPDHVFNYDEVYTQVIAGWVLERGPGLVAGGVAGSDEYPMVWAAFRK